MKLYQIARVCLSLVVVMSLLDEVIVKGNRWLIIDRLRHLTGGNIDKACIIRLRGEVLETHGFPHAYELSEDEIHAIVTVFEWNDFSNFTQHGIEAEGLRYRLLYEINDEQVVGMRKNNESIIIMKVARKYLLVIHCPEGADMKHAIEVTKDIFDKWYEHDDLLIL